MRKNIKIICDAQTSGLGFHSDFELIEWNILEYSHVQSLLCWNFSYALLAV
tara:strand:- start:49756 stop:49908 length:153 start_codon:yes stop_codon:yes gene_type:complete